MKPPPAPRRLATEYEDASASPGLLLWQVTNQWQAATRAALTPLGLTHVQFVLLASLTWLDTQGPVTQKRLADHAVTDPMMTSQVLRALELRGLVERRPHPGDKRARAVSVTTSGVALANEGVKAAEAVDRTFFGVLGDGLPMLTAALAALAETRSDSARQAAAPLK